MNITKICSNGSALKIRRSSGFTLIELLVVLVILTLLAGLVGPKVLDQLGGRNRHCRRSQGGNSFKLATWLG